MAKPELSNKFILGLYGTPTPDEARHDVYSRIEKETGIDRGDVEIDLKAAFERVIESGQELTADVTLQVLADTFDLSGEQVMNVMYPVLVSAIPRRN